MLNYKEISDYLEKLRIFWSNKKENVVMKIQAARTISEGVKILKQYIRAEPRFGGLDSTHENILRIQLKMIIKNLEHLGCGELPLQPKAVTEFLKG